MAGDNDNEPMKKKGGCMGKLLGLLVFGVLVGLGAAIYYVTLPQDLSDIGGYSLSTTKPSSTPRDINAVLTKAIEVVPLTWTGGIKLSI